LEALAGLLVAVLLALDHPGVAGEVLALAEGGLQVGAVFLEGPGEAEDDGAGLAALAAPLDVDEHVDPAAHLGGGQRGADGVAVPFLGEVGVALQAVDEELAGPLPEADAGDGGLAAAGAPDELGRLCRGHVVVSILKAPAGQVGESIRTVRMGPG